MLDLKMKQFKGVVPLMVSLKNEAMRERHWKELMLKTGRIRFLCVVPHYVNKLALINKKNWVKFNINDKKHVLLKGKKRSCHK